MIDSYLCVGLSYDSVTIIYKSLYVHEVWGNPKDISVRRYVYINKKFVCMTVYIVYIKGVTVDEYSVDDNNETIKGNSE